MTQFDIFYNNIDIMYAKEKGCSMQGTMDSEVEYLNVLV